MRKNSRFYWCLRRVLGACIFFPRRILESIELFNDKPVDSIALAFTFGFLWCHSSITGFLLMDAIIRLIKGRVDSASEVGERLGWAVWDATAALVAIWWLKSESKKQGKEHWAILWEQGNREERNEGRRSRWR
jgi:hypothetical protein